MWQVTELPTHGRGNGCYRLLAARAQKRAPWLAHRNFMNGCMAW